MKAPPCMATVVRRMIVGAGLIALAGCATAVEPPSGPASTAPSPTAAAPPPAGLTAAPASRFRSRAATARTSEPELLRQEGSASWYGDWHHGKETASGDLFDKDALTAAHPTLPFGARVRVVNLENDRSVEVTINDRGPYVAERVIDLSEAAARRLGFKKDGVTRVRVEELPALAASGKDTASAAD